MQAFSACFMKFCLALNSYILQKKCAEVVRSQQTFAHFFLFNRSFLDAPTFLFYNKL